MFLHLHFSNFNFPADSEEAQPAHTYTSVLPAKKSMNPCRNVDSTRWSYSND